MCEPEAEAESAHFVSPEQLKAAQRQDASRDRRVAREKAASDQLDQAMGQIQSPALQPVGLNSPQSSPRPGRVSSAGPIASSVGPFCHRYHFLYYCMLTRHDRLAPPNAARSPLANVARMRTQMDLSTSLSVTRLAV